MIDEREQEYNELEKKKKLLLEDNSNILEIKPELEGIINLIHKFYILINNEYSEKNIDSFELKYSINTCENIIKELIEKFQDGNDYLELVELFNNKKEIFF